MRTKLILTIIALLCSCLSVNAQAYKPIKILGVEYNTHSSSEGISVDSIRLQNDGSYLIELYNTNMNSIPVSVDAELYSAIREHSSVEYRLITIKSFTLKSGETYIWKFENNGHFKVNYHGRIYHDVYTRDEPGDSDYGYSISYYVKYKAYKLL